MRIQKHLAALVMSLLLCGAFAVNASAHEIPDLDRTGSISGTMLYDGEAVGGGSLILYKTGDVAEDDGNYSFTLTDAFAGSGLSLEDLESDTLAAGLAEYASDNSIAGTEVSIASDGTWSVSGLELGLYLAVQENPAEGFEAIAPFVVSLPMFENGAYVYEVSTEPKMGALTESVVTPEPALESTSESGSADSSGSGTSSAETAGTTGSTLPQTGQMNWPVPVLAVMGICLLLAGWTLYNGKQENQSYAA